MTKKKTSSEEITEVEVKEEVSPTETKEISEKEVKQMVKEEKKHSHDKSLFQRILNIVLWIIVLVWMLVCIIDFINVHDEKEPKFTFSSKVVTFDDENDTKGTAKAYYGAGYVVYKYTSGTCRGGLEFAPFWTKPRTGCR